MASSSVFIILYTWNNELSSDVKVVSGGIRCIKWQKVSQRSYRPNKQRYELGVYSMATTGELRAIIEQLQLVDIGDAADYLGENELVEDEYSLSTLLSSSNVFEGTAAQLMPMSV